MQNYRPKPAPVSTRFLKNPMLHIAVIFVLVFAGALHIIREQRQQEISRRVDYLRNGPIYTEQTAQKNTKPVAAEEAETESVSEPAAQTADASASGNVERSAASEGMAPPPQAMMAAVGETTAPSGSAAEGAETSPAEAPRPREVRLRVRYALAPRPVLFRILESNRSQGQFVDFGEFQMGSVRSSGLKDQANSLYMIEEVQKTFANPQAEQMWFVGGKVGEQQLGLTTKINLRGFEGETLRGEIELLRNLHETADLSQGAIPKGYGPGDFGLAPQSTLMVILTLPTVPQYDEQNFTPSQFLRIFRMPDFKQKQSEFVMLFDFQ